ncbi:MAG: hypothetical protein ABS68_10630 [Niastella sp. SCN 39-18]|nr:hypothetical protein [Sphingobacteriales bacterium]ODT52140.1 MAG: hypothetical protein ABS68_10630 [Niastella sp. SCN 39-18]OJW11100.1 MAG: hypothetical protein BGO53_01980 [Sphingobacteriales bacterium 39-19]
MWKLAGILIFILISCNDSPRQDVVNTTEEKLGLIKTDESFSDMSVAKGYKAAFMEYIDSNGVLLRPGSVPLIGATAIDFLLQTNDSNFSLQWKPQNAYVSKSADMGYTYGIYALHPHNADTILYGTYVSIWKKEENGKWKFVLDSGNEGISPGK